MTEEASSPQVERGLRELEILSELAGWINATLDPLTVLGAVGEAARELTAADAALIAMPESPDTSAMMARHWSGLQDEEIGRLRVEPGQGAGGQVMLTHRPFRTDDYVADRRISDDFDGVARREGIVAMLVVPVISGARLEGLIYVIRRSPRPFGDEDEAVLLRLAAYAGVAVGNARLYEQVRAGRERLELLSRRLLEVQETERRELARELHDQMGQALTALKLNLQALPVAQLGVLEPALADTLAIVDRLIEQVRHLTFQLRPSILDDVGLAAAIRWYVDREARRGRLRATVRVEVNSERLAPVVETAAFRVTQEAITNVLRHAKATSVMVEVRRRDDALELVVADDGAGFDAETARQRGTLGLLGMEERVALLGGSLEIESAVGYGTEVRARLPLAPR